MKVMVIDDSSLVLSVVRSFLESAGHEVVTRTTGLGARAALLRERPDVVLLDVNMPALDGAEICTSIRAHASTRHACVLLHSSRPADELRELTARAGADGFICKTDDRGIFLARFDRLRPQTPSGRPDSFEGRYLLAVCADALHDRLSRELVLSTHPLRVTSSGAEALDLLLSRDAPRLLMLGSQLRDMSWDALRRRAVEDVPAFADRMIFIRDDPEMRVGPGAPIWDPAEPVQELEQRLRELGVGR